jgi:23S rRNA (uracil1939-C5)-methyltransferase
VSDLFCRHFGVCGGCDLPTTSYAEQLQVKSAKLAAHLKQAGISRAVSFEPVFPLSPAPRGFRQKVAFTFGAGPRGRGLVMGHYARGSKDLVPVVECPVHNERGNRIAFALRDLLAQAGIEAAGGSRRGIVRHLMIRTSQDNRQAVAMLVVARNDKSLRRPVRALLESSDTPDGFFINIHPDPGRFMIGHETIRIAGSRHVLETINGLSYLVSPTAFFQTNALAAAALQRLVVAGCEGDRILDLYCGSGLFSLPLARKAERVVAIEENPQAIKDAEANARMNHIPAGRIRFVPARVEEGLARLPRGDWSTVVLDPPREGCSAAVIKKVFVELHPSRVVYVSCNPAALATELPAMLGAGYRIDGIRAVDMFPHTEHIETVLRLEKASDSPQRRREAQRLDGLY